MTHPALTLLRHDVAPPAPAGPADVATALDPWVAQVPGSLALIDRDVQLTYGQLDEAVNRAARALGSLGVGPTDRVAVSLPNTAPIVVAFLAAMRLGVIWVGINRNLTPAERAHILDDTEASVYLYDDQSPEPGTTAGTARAIELVEWNVLNQAQPPGRVHIGIDACAPAAIAYTSGTTGVPKGVVHSQHNLVVTAIANGALAAAPASRQGVVLPLTILNLMILGPVAAFCGGATLVAVDRLDAVGIAERVRRDRIQGFAAPPAIVHDLLTNPEVDPGDLESLTDLGVGAAGVTPGLEDRYRQRFGRGFGTGYGLTEAPASVSRAWPGNERLPGSSGTALPHVLLTIRDEDDQEVECGDDGEVCVEAAGDGPWGGVYTPMLGYWNNPEASRQALRGGRLHTGDIGRLDSDGNLFITGRRNDLIIRGGANVYPAEVERVLEDHPAVNECAVVGKPDDRLGEVVVAFIRPVRDATCSGEELTDHCQRHLARYKIPVEFHLVDSFPRNAMGKIVKQTLREQLA